MDKEARTLDAIFNHVKGALSALDEDRPASARKLLGMIYGSLAVITLQSTEADPGSPHWMLLVKTIEKEFPPDEDWQDHI